jgi:hypothetical protein
MRLPLGLLALFLALLLVLVPAARAEHGGPAATPAPGGMWAARMKAAKPLAISAAFDQRGRLWLLRVERGHVLIEVSEDGGNRFAEPVRVNPEPEAVSADGENRPKLAIAANGTVHVSWTVSLPRPYTGHVRYSRSTDGGRSFSPPVTVNDDLAEVSHRFDALAVEGDRVVLAWLDGRDRKAALDAGRDYAGSALYYAVSSDGGATFQANRRFAEHTCECCRVALGWQGGQPVALWRHVYPGGIRDFALAALDGAAVPRRVSDDDWLLLGCPHHGGALSADAKGALHLVWYTQGKTRQGLFYRRLERDVLSEPMKFGNDEAQAGHATVLATGNTVTLAWSEFDGKAYGVWIRQSPDGGRTWLAPCRVLTSEGAADYPLLVARRGQPWLVWNSEREGVRALPLEGADSGADS